MKNKRGTAQQRKNAGMQQTPGGGRATAQNLPAQHQRTQTRLAYGLLPQASRLSNWMLSTLSSRGISSLSQAANPGPETTRSVGAPLLPEMPPALLPERFRKLADAAPDDPFIAAARRYLAGRGP